TENRTLRWRNQRKQRLFAVPRALAAHALELILNRFEFGLLLRRQPDLSKRFRLLALLLQHLGQPPVCARVASGTGLGLLREVLAEAALGASVIIAAASALGNDAADLKVRREIVGHRFLCFGKRGVEFLPLRLHGVDAGERVVAADAAGIEFDERPPALLRFIKALLAAEVV